MFTVRQEKDKLFVEVDGSIVAELSLLRHNSSPAALKLILKPGMGLLTHIPVAVEYQGTKPTVYQSKGLK